MRNVLQLVASVIRRAVVALSALTPSALGALVPVPVPIPARRAYQANGATRSGAGAARR